MAGVENQLNIFRKWVNEQQPILNSIDTDEFLLRFLRVENFNLDHAKEHLVLFWKYRMENPQWFVFECKFLENLLNFFSFLGLQIVIL